MAKPLEVNNLWVERIIDTLRGIEFGSVVITVHDGHIVQIDRTERKRFELTASEPAKAGFRRGRQGGGVVPSQS
jgi:hypothetical protein